MAEGNHGACNYEPYTSDLPTGDVAIPSRYRTTRRGKRRQTTLVKRKSVLEQNPSEMKYKIASDDASTSSVDENYEVDSITSSLEETLTWRGRMQVALHSPWIHIIIVALVVADALIVVFELLLDVGAFGNLKCEGETTLEQKEVCHYAMHSDCGPPAKLILEGLNISASPGSGTGRDGLCICKFRRGLRVCDDKDGDDGVNPGLVLHIASLLILTVFVLEILLKLIAFHLKYFTHKFEVFDGTIVVVSYLLDWTSLQEEEAFEAASLVIILRLWRVVRIVNGAVLSAKSRSDQQLSEARLKARTIIHAFHKAQDRLDVLEEENRKLKKGASLKQYKYAEQTNGDIHGVDAKAMIHDEMPPAMPEIIISQQDESKL